MNDKLRRSAMLRVALDFLFLAPIVFPAQLPAQSRKPMTVAEIATYMGPDREQLLYAGAKAEGVVTWYTSLAGDSYKALARSFETNYPGLRGFGRSVEQFERDSDQWERFAKEISQR